MLYLMLVLALAIGASWARRFRRARAAALGSTPRFVARRRDHHRPSARVLLFGDAAAFGADASCPAQSVAGLLAHAYRGASIGNLSSPGHRLGDAVRQAKRLARRLAQGRSMRAPQPYDLLLIHAGGPDVLHGTTSRQLMRELHVLLKSALAVSKHVVIVTGGNGALAADLPAPVRAFITWRSRQVQSLLRRETAGHARVLLVELFNEWEHPLVRSRPAAYTLPHTLHSADARQRLWFEEIDAALRTNNIHLGPRALQLWGLPRAS